MSLTDRLNQDPASAWRPDKEDAEIVEGKVIAIDSNDGGYGEYPILTIATATGEKAIHGFHTVLKQEILKQQPQVGDTIGVKYLGEQTSKDGKTTFVGYRMVTEKAEGSTFSYGGMTVEDEATPEAETEAAPEQPAGGDIPPNTPGSDDNDIPF